MSPGEIVAKIRSGARIDQIGSFTGVDIKRIVLFAIEVVAIAALQDLCLVVIDGGTEISTIKFLAP